MYLLYLDASGTAEPKDISTKHYVLVGLCMPERAWFGLERRIQALKRRYSYPGSDPDNFELHVKQFAVTYEEQKLIPDVEALSWADRRAQTLAVRKQMIDAEPTRRHKKDRADRYRSTDPYIHLSRAERSRLLDEAVDVIANYDSIKLFGEAVCKAHPSVVQGRVDPVREAFTQVVSRFDTLLQKKDTLKLQTSPRRFIDHGLLILDQDASTEATIEGLFRRFREQGHPFGNMTHVIDVPFFAPSVKVSGLQIADVAAYIVRRYVDTGARPGSFEERNFQKLYSRFDRDSYGRLHGMRHYIPPNTCRCMVCVERGHAAPAPPPSSG